MWVFVVCMVVSSNNNNNNNLWNSYFDLVIWCFIIIILFNVVKVLLRERGSFIFIL